MRGIHTCCPSPVSTINVNQNIVEMDGTRAFWVEAASLGSAYNPATGIVLEYTPYARSQLSVILNTAQLRQGVDFTVSANAVYFTFVPVADDKIVVRYFALTDSTSSILADSTLTTGMTLGYSPASDTPPSGWLFMDGSKAHLKTGDNAALWAFLAANTSYLVAGSYAGDTFTLALINTPFYNGTTLVTGKTLIKL